MVSLRILHGKIVKPVLSDCRRENSLKTGQKPHSRYKIEISLEFHSPTILTVSAGRMIFLTGSQAASKPIVATTKKTESTSIGCTSTG